MQDPPAAEESSQLDDVSAHHCQLCWSQFAKPGCIKRLGNAWKEARFPLRKGQKETGTAGESGGSGVQGKEPQRQKALGKVLGSQTYEPRHAAKHFSLGSHCLKRAFEEKLGSTNMFLLLPLEGTLPLHSGVLHPTWRRTVAGGLATASAVGNGGLGVSMRSGIQTLQVEGREGSVLLPTLLSKRGCRERARSGVAAEPPPRPAAPGSAALSRQRAPRSTLASGSWGGGQGTGDRGAGSQSLEQTPLRPETEALPLPRVG